MISARRYLSYKLECSIGISTCEKNRKTLRENHDFSVVFKTANQLLTYYLLYSAPWMSGNAFCFWNVKYVRFFLLVTRLYNKQNDTWLLGDVEFLFSCSILYREIPHLPVPIYHSLYLQRITAPNTNGYRLFQVTVRTETWIENDHFFFQFLAQFFKWKLFRF